MKIRRIPAPGFNTLVPIIQSHTHTQSPIISTNVCWLGVQIKLSRVYEVSQRLQEDSWLGFQIPPGGQTKTEQVYLSNFT